MRRLKGIIRSRLNLLIYYLAYRGFVPHSWSTRLIKLYWEDSAAAIHREWGSGTDDFQVLTDIITRYHPQALLDAGCGSGRLFTVYRQCGIADVTGTDISANALEIAKRTFPAAKLRQISLEDLDYPKETFDLGVCNRVLQHVPAHIIRSVVKRLCHACRLVYVNELTQSDDLDETFWMRRHNYSQLFGEFGFVCLETGRVGKQTYFLFERLPNFDSLTTSLLL